MIFDSQNKIYLVRLTLIHRVMCLIHLDLDKLRLLGDYC